MRRQVLLLLTLLTLLGLGCSLRLVHPKGSLDPPAARARRQAPADGNWDAKHDDDDYVEEETDPPEVLDKALATTPHPNPVTELGTQGRGDPAGARTQEPEPSGAAGSQDAGGADGKNVSSREPPPVQVQPTPDAPPTKEPPPTAEAPPTTTEAPPTTTEAPPTTAKAPLTTEPPPTTKEAPPTTTEAPPTTKDAPPATAAPPTQAPPTETTPSETTPTAAEAQTTGPTATEVLPDGRAILETLSTKLPAVADPPTESTTTRVRTALPAAPRDLTPAAGGDFFRQKNGTSAMPGSSVTPGATKASDHIPVKQCLLAILILALVATVFLVCTVVLAVRLSRKTHMYPLRSYSPTEMVCISSLLPEGGGGGGGEGSGTAANGGPPTGKSADSKAKPGEEREDDDLTLRSFLP